MGLIGVTYVNALSSFYGLVKYLCLDVNYVFECNWTADSATVTARFVSGWDGVPVILGHRGLQ